MYSLYTFEPSCLIRNTRISSSDERHGVSASSLATGTHIHSRYREEEKKSAFVSKWKRNGGHGTPRDGVEAW